MSFNQYRTNPSQAVSSFKGRSETPKAWPSTAVGNWTNGGLFGGGYVLEDSYKFFTKGSYSGMMNIANIPQTHRHLHIDFTMSQQSTWWSGLGTIVFNASTFQQYQDSNGQWDGMKGLYWGKGWSTGNFANNTGPRDPWVKPTIGHSNISNTMSLQIYNYSSSTEVLKLAKFWSQYSTGNQTSYAVWMDGFGYFQASAGTQGGAASPAITSMRSYDGYQNGSSSYQSYNIYGFGGLV
jgi:hypothetical protein